MERVTAQRSGDVGELCSNRCRSPWCEGRWDDGYVDDRGYFRVYLPAHPTAYSNGFVRRSRAVLWLKTGVVPEVHCSCSCGERDEIQPWSASVEQLVVALPVALRQLDELDRSKKLVRPSFSSIRLLQECPAFGYHCVH